MYTLDDVGMALRNPGLVLTELNRFYHRGFANPGYNPNGIGVFDEDWDVLVILDACRYDVFAEVVGDDLGTEPLESRTSRGSATREWIRGNFTDRRLHDVLYLDSNGYFGRLKQNINAEVFKYVLVENDAFGGISVHPDRVTEAAIETAQTYPDKRLLVHYMQPHQPFFGPSATDIEQTKDLPRTVLANRLDQETVRRCHRENLEIALESVQRLVEQLNGRIVVTADHGELLGDRQTPIPVTNYGHPAGLYVPELVRVPWLIHENGPRPEIREGAPQRDEIGLSGEELDQKLRDLGYAV